MLTHYNQIMSYTTRDGSIIRELMHPDIHGNNNQSLAEAIIPVGTRTHLHSHQKSEEIYHVTRGEGCMRLGNAEFNIKQGDTIVITPGTQHNVYNSGKKNLHILCCCSPAYSHDDTELIYE